MKLPNVYMGDVLCMNAGVLVKLKDRVTRKLVTVNG